MLRRSNAIRDGKCLFAFENKVIDDLRLESTDFLVPSQAVNILGFEGHMGHVVATPLCRRVQINPDSTCVSVRSCVVSMLFIKTCSGTDLAPSPLLVKLT